MPMLANVSGGQSNQAMLKNLQPNTVYVFFVSAITTSGRVLTDERSVRVTMPAGEYFTDAILAISSMVKVCILLWAHTTNSSACTFLYKIASKT